MPVIALSPRLAVHAIVRMQEHDQARLRKRTPDRLEALVVESLPDALAAHDDALQVRQTRDLLDGVDERRSGDVRHEREQAEAE